ncbi:MAG TPA: hypothetical protein VHD32_18970 [Candidatus Didemnitutus sp.]|nr:hypothetical protein [Candidatus Didemnitutus sp.]
MRRCWFLAGVFAAASALAADDAKAPLTETSTQLHQLQKQQADAKAGGEDNSLRSALPTLGTTLQGREALPSTDPTGTGRDGKHKQPKKDLGRTWLLDAYDKLDPKANHDKDATLPAVAGSSIESDDRTADEAKDPSTKIDIFALYENDPKKDSAKTPDPNHTAFDPLAPFLQSWMSKTSPHDASLPGTSKADVDSLFPIGAPAVSTPAGSTAPALDALASAPDGTATPAGGPDNPYLAALTLPPPSATGAPLSLLPSGLPDLGAPPVPAKPLIGLPADSAPSAKTELSKPPPSQADEDRKYFPQLKRF